MTTAMQMMGNMLAEEMAERERERADHETELEKERAETKRMTDIEGAISALQEAVAGMTKQLIQIKETAGAKLHDPTVDRIETMVRALAMNEAADDGKEITFDLMSDGAGNIRKIVARKAKK